MKKALIILVVIIAVIAFVAYQLVSNLDGIVKSAIETVGGEALGVDVSVASVAIDLGQGTGTISGFEIANPPGYSRNPALSVGELSLDLGSDGTIERIHLGAPEILVEPKGETSNYDDLLAGLSEDTPTESESEVVDEAGEPVELTIGRVEIEAARAVVTREDDEPIEVAISELVFTNLQGTSEEIAEQILRQLIGRVVEDTKQAVREAAGQAVEEAVEDVKEGLRGKLEEALTGGEDDG